MKDLERLEQEFRNLSEDFNRKFHPYHDDTMTQILNILSERHNSASVPKDLITELLLMVKEGQLPSTFSEIKYICYGLCQRLDSNSWVLIEDKTTLDIVLAQVQAFTANPAALKRCYQGLLTSFFLYPGVRDNNNENGNSNWRKLQTFLVANLHRVLAVEPASTWLETLAEHRNLLGEEPCKRYGISLLNGDGSEFNDVCTALSIPPNSWVREDAILAQVETLAERQDAVFKTGLDGLLALLRGDTQITVTENIAIRGLAKLIIRYSQCDNKEVHEGLRDLAVIKIGNPWLRTDAWKGYVDNEEARAMVNGWLKRRLITDFFGILSEDRSADSRRLKFWMKFEPLVTDLWIALGSSAMNDRGSNYQELRRRADGRLLLLVDCPSTHNSFIMKIGKFYVVECGIVGKCFIYEDHERPFQLDDVNEVSEGYQEGGLKSNHAGIGIRHGDTSEATWEETFQNYLCKRLNWWPSEKLERSGSQIINSTKRVTREKTRDNSSDFFSLSKKLSARATKSIMEWTNSERKELSDFITANKLGVDNKLNKGGAFWITHSEVGFVRDQLKTWGFALKENRGWWKV